MANPEHVKVVKQGADAIDAWRNENPGVVLDLQDCDLSGHNLDFVDLRGANLTGSFLHNCRLIGANFENANLARASLCSTIHADPRMYHGAIPFTCFDEANLCLAFICDSYLEATSFVRANLGFAYIGHCSLVGVDMSEANLQDADMHDTLFTRMVLKETVFTDSRWAGNTIADTDLSTAIGLEQTVHGGPTSIGVDSIIRSKGAIPPIFLELCGIPAKRIIEMNDVNWSDDYYSCFISYSEVDGRFSQKLDADLRNAGIQCWRYREDARGGRSLIQQIDEAIRKHDKVILICSKDSLNSPAVLREVDRALEKEDALQRAGNYNKVLFPISIDDYVYNWKHYREADVRNAYISDFRNWTDPESYNKALDRLIRDLQAEKS